LFFYAIPRPGLKPLAGWQTPTAETGDHVQESIDARRIQAKDVIHGELGVDQPGADPTARCSGYSSSWRQSLALVRSG